MTRKDKVRVGIKSWQTVTDFGLTRFLDFITGDGNAPSGHMSGTDAQLQVVRVDADGNSMTNLTLSGASPTVGRGTYPTGHTQAGKSYARMTFSWEDSSDDVYTAQSAKLYNGTPSTGQDVMSASSLTGSKADDKIATYNWQLDAFWQTQPSGITDEIGAGLEQVLRPIRYSSATRHWTSSTLYAFLDTAGSTTPSRISDPIHDGTTDWTVSVSVSRDRTNHPHQLTLNVNFDGPATATAVTGVYVGWGAITDNPRAIIYGKRESLSISGQYSTELTFEFANAS